MLYVPVSTRKNRAAHFLTFSTRLQVFFCCDVVQIEVTVSKKFAVRRTTQCITIKEPFLLNCMLMLPYLNNILVTKLQICEQYSYAQCLAMIIEEDGKTAHAACVII